MSTTVFAQRCVTGNIESYLFKMKAGTLIDIIGYAEELDEWDDMSVDERIQRQINGARVANEIVPYVTTDPDWFFGSLIVDLYIGGDKLKFQTIDNVVDIKFDAYADSLEDVGFLTLPDSKRLIALDGQHRLAALNMAIKGKNGVPGSVDEKAIPLEIRNQLVKHPEIAESDISVILLNYGRDETRRIRKIFNKVNRYAKQTSRSDNIITSEDDIIAIVSRDLFSKSDGPLRKINEQEIVNWTSNTISLRSKQLTTLSALYTSSETILQHYGITPKTPVSDEVLAQARKIVYDYWKTSLDNIDVFKTYIEYTKTGKSLANIRNDNLLLKPVTHMALAQAAKIALDYGYEYKDIVGKFNQINWSKSNKVWSNILVSNSSSKKMITGSTALRDAGLLIAYRVIGYKFSDDDMEALKKKLRNAWNIPEDEPVDLPPIVQ